jgi:hypothetical protein
MAVRTESEKVSKTLANNSFVAAVVSSGVEAPAMSISFARVPGTGTDPVGYLRALAADALEMAEALEAAVAESAERRATVQQGAKA